MKILFAFAYVLFCLSSGIQSVSNETDFIHWQQTLYEAIHQNNYQKFLVAISRVSLHETKPSEIGMYPLHMAALFGRNSMVTRLIRSGALVNQKDPHQMTPIAYSVTHPLTLQMLLALGARADLLQGRKQRTVLHFAVRAQNLASVKELCGIMSIQRSLLYHADLLNGNTALHEAVEVGNKSIVEFLLKSGALARKANRAGRIPLHEAVVRDRLPIVQSLLQTDPKSVRVLDSNGQSSLLLAAQRCFPEMVGELLRAEAEIDQNLLDQMMYGKSSLLCQRVMMILWERLETTDSENAIRSMKAWSRKQEDLKMDGVDEGMDEAVTNLLSFGQQ